MDLEGFQRFMDIYLEVETPRELIKRLFLSFVKKSISPNKISVGKHCVGSQSVPEGTKLLTVSNIAQTMLCPMLYPMLSSLIHLFKPCYSVFTRFSFYFSLFLKWVFRQIYSINAHIDCEKASNYMFGSISFNSLFE